MDHNPEETLARQVNRKKKENRKTKVNQCPEELHSVKVNHHLREACLQEVNQSFY